MQGVIEIGMVMYSLQEKIAGIFQNIIVKVSLLVIVAVFAVNEFAGFLNRRASRKKSGKQTRGFSFILCTAGHVGLLHSLNLPSVFLPVSWNPFILPACLLIRLPPAHCPSRQIS